MGVDYASIDGAKHQVLGFRRLGPASPGCVGCAGVDGVEDVRSEFGNRQQVQAKLAGVKRGERFLVVNREVARFEGRWNEVTFAEFGNFECDEAGVALGPLERIAIRIGDQRQIDYGFDELVLAQNVLAQDVKLVRIDESRRVEQNPHTVQDFVDRVQVAHDRVFESLCLEAESIRLAVDHIVQSDGDQGGGEQQTHCQRQARCQRGDQFLPALHQ